MPLNQTQQVTAAIVEAYGIATEKRHEFITPEHLIAGFLKDMDFWDTVSRCGNAEELETNIYQYLNNLESIPENNDLTIEFSAQLEELFSIAAETATSAGVQNIRMDHIIYSYFHLEESHARFNIERCLECSIPDFLNSLISSSEGSLEVNQDEDRLTKYLITVDPKDNLIGRKEEIDRIIRALCRKSKNNALLVGGRGTGKSAIAHGLAHLLSVGSVPEKLKEKLLFELDINALLSGTQYRGDLENRVNGLMKAAAEDGNIIIYIDELRSLGGSSKMDDASKDILNLLTRYFKSGNISFIISSTHEDIKKLMTYDAGIMGLFRQVDIDEPSDEDTERILQVSLPSLSEHHGVSYDPTVPMHAIKMSRRYILDRCLPDKAMDLLDEAGSYCETHNEKTVTQNTVDLALADICRIDVQASDEDTRKDLFNMEEGLKKKIYGQEKAIKTISESILMSKAGLLDSGKTIGNFLFVGPTGVGKTELSKVLAEQLHVPLHRFDMSEYSEKHSVAKLIGSPAGYVGYDDGGILTDLIRKNPYCILLLDEIEKAHEDIFNLLLQVMDYAVITDNKGRKVDFRNVVLIMTSNAGARHAHKPSVGFDRKSDAGHVMAKEVKNIFAPEFINRLTSVVVFNDMDKKMASLILDDKIRRLQERLNDKSITLNITENAYTRLLEEGFSSEYGAREIERILNARITPLLMREILFGAKEKFTATIETTENGYDIRPE